MALSSLRGALATKQSILAVAAQWIASLALAMTVNLPLHPAANIGQMHRSYPLPKQRFHNAE
jgi:hypothetical protein